MAVPCPRCGRSYDVALFQFGRTLDCSCGARVGLEPRRDARPPAPRRFAVDAMLGRLARWLRIIGVDATYDPAIADDALVRQALDERRVLLTRDRKLVAAFPIPHLYVVRSERALEQLREVVRAFDLDWRTRVFTRCSRCNTSLEPVDPHARALQIPPRVLSSTDAFVTCRSCGRVYWSGSHVDRMWERLQTVLGPAATSRRAPSAR